MPHSYERKIIRVGDTSYGIILPIAWVRYNQLDEQSSVEVISNDAITIVKREEDEDGAGN